MIATLEYAKSVVDECNKSDSQKFEKYNTSTDKIKSLLDRRYLTNLDFSDKTCVVIGNGGSVLDKELGQKIDEHDIIVRTNLGMSEGFEKHVGSRTDIRFMSAKSFGNPLNHNGVRYSQYHRNYLPLSQKQHIIIRSAGKIGSLINGWAMNTYSEHTFSILDLSYNKQLDEHVKHTMLDFGCKVSICGFDFYMEEENKYHYFEDTIKSVETGFPNHNMISERKYIKDLESRDKINIL